MTQQLYLSTIDSFEIIKTKPQTSTIVDVLGKGKDELKKLSDEMGLAFDDWDLDYYFNLFKHKMKRNPTLVECFDLAQSNSEHSRHWFFRVIYYVYIFKNIL